MDLCEVNMDVLKVITKCVFVFLVIFSQLVFASDLRIGVSQSVIRPIQRLCESYEKATSHHCIVTSTSTGHLYAQSMHTNLFDILVGSNMYYANGLIHAGKADPKAHYQLGASRLILWSSDPNAKSEWLYHRLMNDPKTPIVIPDPKIANYGLATKETLQNLDIWALVQKRLILAPSIRQAYEVLRSNPNYIGFVSLSQLTPQARTSQTYWEPDSTLHEPVIHDLIVMNTNTNQVAQKAFIEFITTHDICPIFAKEGYLCKLNRL